MGRLMCAVGAVLYNILILNGGRGAINLTPNPPVFLGGGGVCSHNKGAHISGHVPGHSRVVWDLVMDLPPKVLREKVIQPHRPPFRERESQGVSGGVDLP